MKVSLSWTVSPNSCAAALIGTDDGQFWEDEIGASLSTFSDDLQGSPKWLSRSTKDIDRLYEFWVPLLLSINGAQRRTAELIWSTEEDSQRLWFFELILRTIGSSIKAAKRRFWYCSYAFESKSKDHRTNLALSRHWQKYLKRLAKSKSHV